MSPADVAGLSEGSHYAWDPVRHAGAAHHRLVVVARSPTQTERAAFRAAARWTLALLVEGPVVLLLWRAAGWPWSEAPYSWHAQGLAPWTVPDTADPGPPGRVPFDCLLVDAATGQGVAAVRHAVPWAPLVRALHTAIAAQARGPRDPAAYDATLARLLAESSSALAARAPVQVECGGAR